MACDPSGPNVPENVPESRKPLSEARDCLMAFSVASASRRDFRAPENQVTITLHEIS